MNAVEKELTDKEDKLIAAKAAQDKAIGTLILDNLDEQIPKERIILKLQKHFVLTEEKSTRYYEKDSSPFLACHMFYQDTHPCS